MEFKVKPAKFYHKKLMVAIAKTFSITKIHNPIINCNLVAKPSSYAPDIFQTIINK